MSGTRLVKAIKDINREDVASAAVTAIGGTSFTYFATAAISHHLPTVMNGLNWASDHYIGASSLIGGLNAELFRGLYAVRNGATISAKTIAGSLAAITVAAEIVDVAYTSLTSYYGHTPEPAEVAVVKSLGTEIVAAGLRFAGEKAAKLSIFNKKPAVDHPAGFEQLLNESSLNTDPDLEANTTSAPVSPTRRSSH
jgi:hypothetical protein